jgi:hypothetical protein
MEFIIHNVRLLNGEEIKIREAKNGDVHSVCPVCGFISHADLPWSMGRSTDEQTGREFGEAFGGASFDICPCCDAQYGLDDMFSEEGKPPMPEIWEGLRIKWLDRTGWKPEALKQLRDNLDIHMQAIKPPDTQD